MEMLGDNLLVRLDKESVEKRKTLYVNVLLHGTVVASPSDCFIHKDDSILFTAAELTYSAEDAFVMLQDVIAVLKRAVPSPPTSIPEPPNRYRMCVLNCCSTLHEQVNGAGETAMEVSDEAAAFLRERLADWVPYHDRWAGYEALVHALILESLREYDAWQKIILSRNKED